MAQAKYRQILDSLKKRILEGKFGPSCPFPSEAAVLAAPGRLDGNVALVAETDDLPAIRRHLRSRRPEAIVCLNDADAAMLIQTLARLGLSVPRDILVAGFNDVNIAKITNPPPTTIHQPCGQIADAAFGRLIARIRNPNLPATEFMLPAPLVVRDSTLRAGGKKS